MFNTLDRDGIKDILSKFPSIFNNIKDSLAKYQDENFELRRMLVRNIPFLRTASREVINKVVLMMKPQFYNMGDVIMEGLVANDSIYVVMRGRIQARVIHFNRKGEKSDLWLQNLH